MRASLASLSSLTAMGLYGPISVPIEAALANGWEKVLSEVARSTFGAEDKLP